MVAVSSDINKMENFFHGALVRLVASRCEYLNGHRDNNTRHCTEPTRGGARWGHYRLFGTAREIFIDTIKSIFIKDK